MDSPHINNDQNVEIQINSETTEVNRQNVFKLNL